MTKYSSGKHDSFLECPSCHSKNAPQESKDFEKYCYNCGVKLRSGAPVEKGEVLKLTVSDIHRSGDGLARTKEGFVVVIEGVITEETVKAKIQNIRENYAEAVPIERDLDEKPEHEKEKIDEEEEEEEPKYSRENFWGDK